MPAALNNNNNIPNPDKKTRPAQRSQHTHRRRRQYRNWINQIPQIILWVTFYMFMFMVQRHLTNGMMLVNDLV